MIPALFQMCADICSLFKRKVLTEIELHHFSPPISLFSPSKIPSLNPSPITTHFKLIASLYYYYLCVCARVHVSTHACACEYTQPAESIKYKLMSFCC